MKPFPGGALGPDLQVVSAMQGGTIDLNVMNASLLAGNVKEMAALDLPFLFNSRRGGRRRHRRPGRQEADRQAAGQGPRRPGLLGPRLPQMHTKSKPIAKADDFRGLKMRVIPTPIYVEFMNAIGANAVPMPFTETYTALEQGAIDGMTNPLLNIPDGKYNEVSKHLTLTNHMYTPQIVIASKRTWDKLSEEERKILQEAATETAVLPAQGRAGRGREGARSRSRRRA